MPYYIVVYNQDSGEMERLEEFPSGAGSEALDRRFQLERDNQGNPRVEVVMLNAGSVDDLRRTHGRYFMKPHALAS